MRGRKSVGREYLEALLVAVIFATFARTFVVQAFKIPTGSMEENLLVGDHILVNKFIYGPTAYPWERPLLPVRDLERGDVVVFKYPDDPTRDFIKRCVGMPGDVVEIVDKRLLVDGEPFDDESYTYRFDDRVFSRSRFLGDDFRRRDNFGPYRVPPASYFCLGDNRDNSRDSRFWRQTSVPHAYVKGRAFAIYWSFDAPPRLRLEEAQGGGGVARRLATVARHFFTRTRWDRTFRLVR